MTNPLNHRHFLCVHSPTSGAMLSDHPVRLDELISEMREWRSMPSKTRRDHLTQRVGDSEMQMSQQSSQFRVQLVPNSGHSGIGETSELIAGFVDREKRLPIRTAPYRC